MTSSFYAGQRQGPVRLLRLRASAKNYSPVIASPLTPAGMKPADIGSAYPPTSKSADLPRMAQYTHVLTWDKMSNRQFAPFYYIYAGSNLTFTPKRALARP
jgi:hypothetical protein